MKNITILTTGGTFEKTYSETEGTLLNRRSVLKEKIIPKLRLPHTNISIDEIMAKDSLYMNDEDRKLILEHVVKFMSQQQPIVIIHGTDTMQITAEYCLKNHPHPTVAVVFTGAMKPAGYEDSDAIQNFTEALIACTILQPGYYIAFHSHIFKVPNVKKNLQKATFEEV